MVGENPRGWHPPASRATLPAIGHAAAPAATSAARTAGGKSQTYHHCQAQTDSVPGTDSFCVSGGADSDSASFSQQAPAVDLQRTGLETRDSGEYHFVKGQVRRRKKQGWI